MDLGLKNKVALITGGSEGIGLAAAQCLAFEGVRVIICGRSNDKLQVALKQINVNTGIEAEGIVCDITDSNNIDEMFGRIKSVYGRLDILVNNAGTSSANIFEDATEEVWKYDIDLKVFGAIRCSRLAIPMMKSQGEGRIVNVTALGGKTPGAGSVPTSVSRAAGIALTKAMSKDFAKYNILVNTVCIGLVKAGQHETRWKASLKDNPDKSLEQWYSEMGANVPIGRFGEPEEAGNIITFLVSGAASYITGTSINIDGWTSSVL